MRFCGDAALKPLSGPKKKCAGRELPYRLESKCFDTLSQSKNPVRILHSKQLGWDETERTDSLLALINLGANRRRIKFVSIPFIEEQRIQLYSEILSNSKNSHL